MKPLSYRDAGVDIDAGDDLVERIKPLAKRTRIPEVLSDVGGFAGLCGLPKGLEEPILVSGTDGVGTKLKLAFELDRHDDIGQDLVGMCVNDILTCGAKPLFFLDYFATGKLSVETGVRVVAGIARACIESGCALLGGETAEMPGMYQAGEYDLAGFAVGVVDRKKLIDGKSCQAGDIILGLCSSGLHSNGYSLARKVISTHGLSLTEPRTDCAGQTLGDLLMAPTRLYAKATAKLLANGVQISAMSHITGGGLPGNLPRVLPDGLGARLDLSNVPRPVIFRLLQELGPIEESEMRRTFNLGIGFIVIVPKESAETTLALLADEQAHVIGEVISVPEGREFEARVEFEGS